MTDALPWPRARELAASSADPLPPVTLPLEQALGTVLAEPLRSLTPLPAFDTAAMDGYAVAGRGPWQVRQRRLAGDDVPSDPLPPGTACEIATGAWVPPGTEAVLPYEDAVRSGDRVDGVVAVGRNIRRTGEECAVGDTLLGAGSSLTPPAVGLAAAAGHDVLRVHPPPRVALLVTGDELLTSGLPRAGRVRDALGPQLPALVRGCGGLPGEVTRVGDVRAAVTAAVAQADADVVVTTGASSVGPADHLPRVLAELGARVLVRGVACRPGHPQLLARLPDGRWLVGLPGNPLAALSGVVTLLAPLLARLAGRPAPGLVAGHLAGQLTPHAELTRLVPAVQMVSGEWMPLGHHGSAMLRGAARADGLVVVPPGREPVREAGVASLPR